MVTLPRLGLMARSCKMNSALRGRKKGEGKGTGASREENEGEEKSRVWSRGEGGERKEGGKEEKIRQEGGEILEMDGFWITSSRCFLRVWCPKRTPGAQVLSLEVPNNS